MSIAVMLGTHVSRIAMSILDHGSHVQKEAHLILVPVIARLSVPVTKAGRPLSAASSMPAEGVSPWMWYGQMNVVIWGLLLQLLRSGIELEGVPRGSGSSRASV